MGKKIKRLFSLVLVTSMIFTLVGCSKETVSDGEITEVTGVTGNSEDREHITITMYTDASTPSYAIDDTPIGQQILENTNVTLEIEYLVDDEDTKEGLLLASGDLPDLVTSRNVTKFIEAGAVIPLDDLIEEYGEDIKKIYGDDLELFRAEDGHIYHISNSRELAPWSNQPGKAMYIQQAVLKEFDYPEITTLEEYFDIIKQYQDKYPEINGQPTIGFTMLADDWRFGIGVLGAIKFVNGYPDDGEVLVDEIDGVYTSRLLYDSDEAKEYFSMINDLYLEGYFDESSFTSNYDQYIEKIAQGRVLGFHDQYWEFETVNAAVLSVEYPERMYVGLPIVMDESITEYYNQPTPVDATKGIMISNSCEDPERVFQFLNDLCKEENQKLNNWGEEGVEYTVEEDGSFTFNIELWQNTDYLNQRGFKAFDYPFPIMSNLQYYDDGNCAAPDGDTDFMKATYTELDLEVCEAYGWDTLQSAFTYESSRDYGFAWSMNATTNGEDEATYALQAASDTMKSFVPQLVFAEEGTYESVWEQYKIKMEKINIQPYLDFIDNKIIERIEANNKSLP